MDAEKIETAQKAIHKAGAILRMWKPGKTLPEVELKMTYKAAEELQKAQDALFEASDGWRETT